MKLIAVFILKLLVIVIYFLFPTIILGQDKYYIYIPADLSNTERAAIGNIDLLKELMGLGEEKSGIDIEFELIGSSSPYKYKENWELIYKKFLEGKEASTIFSSPIAYIEAIEKKVPLRPYISIAMDGKNKFKYCIYISKESGFTKLGQLKGKKINAVDNRNGGLFILRKLLAAGGFDVDIDKFFSIGVPYKNEISALNALINGKSDCYFSDSVSIKFPLRTIDDSENLIPLLCSREYATISFLGSKNADTEVTKETMKLLKDMYNIPELQNYTELLKEFGFSFIEVNEKDYDDWKILYNEAKRKKWIAGIDRWEKSVWKWTESAIKAGKIKKNKSQ